MTGDNKLPRRKVLVFVHGMYGSNLSNASGRQVWISPYTILKSLWTGNRGHTETALPLTWSGTKQDADDLVADSIMTLTCQPWQTFTSSISDRVDVLDFLWDWRRPVEETSVIFLKWIQQQGLDKERRALVVSYSTGSLLAWIAINKHPDLFEGWVSVGGAVGGGNFMIHDHGHGWKLGPIRLFSAETSFSFTGTYSFFPNEGEPGCKNVFTDLNTKQDAWVDMFDPDEWKRNEIGIYAHAKQQGREVTEQEETHLQNALAASKRFRLEHFYREGATSFDDDRFLLHPKDKYSHLSIVMFGSEAFGTTHKGWWYDGDRIRMDKGPVAGVGDGTVMKWAWNLVPGGLPFKTVTTDTVHIQLLTDDKLIHLVADMLNVEYRRRGDSLRRTVSMLVCVLIFCLAISLAR